MSCCFSSECSRFEYFMDKFSQYFHSAIYVSSFYNQLRPSWCFPSSMLWARPAEQVTRNERWAISLVLPPPLPFFVLLLCKPSLIDINVEKLHHESCFTLHLLRTIIISKQKHPPTQPTARAINYHMAARVLIIMGAAASVYHISSSIVL